MSRLQPQFQRRHLVNAYAYEVKADISVVTAGKTVCSMPERLECEVLQKERYINTLTFTFLPLLTSSCCCGLESASGQIQHTSSGDTRPTDSTPAVTRRRHCRRISEGQRRNEFSRAATDAREPATNERNDRCTARCRAAIYADSGHWISPITLDQSDILAARPISTPRPAVPEPD